MMICGTEATITPMGVADSLRCAPFLRLTTIPDREPSVLTVTGRIRRREGAGI